MLTQKRFQHARQQEQSWLGQRILESKLSAVLEFIPPGHRVLDYGCGLGGTALELARWDCAVTAYDPLPDLVTQARARADRAGLPVEFTSTEPELHSNKWPYITCLDLLDYCANPVSLLTQLRDRLERGGFLVLMGLNCLCPLNWLHPLRRQCSVYTAGSLQWAAERAGLRAWEVMYVFPRHAWFSHTLLIVLTMA